MHYSLARPRDPVVASVVDAALHALTHTEVATRDQVRLQRELVAGDHRHLRLRAQRGSIADGGGALQPDRRPVARARVSAGTSPGARVHPEVVAVMAEIGVDLRGVTPRASPTSLRAARMADHHGLRRPVPDRPGARVEDWPLPDPKGRPLDEVRGSATMSPAASMP